MAVLHGIKALSLIIAAMAFTISCSSGDSKDDDGGGSCPNPSVSGNSMSCGGQSYRTVNINGQVWMAENLNYDPGTGNSACYDNDPANCVTYGRLYYWETAKGVCPSGWHLPSNVDWDKLFRYVDGTSDTSSPYNSPTAGRYLKATSGWDSCGPSGSGNSYLCEDTYGFSALPGSYGRSDGSFHPFGEGNWWSATEYNSYKVYYRTMLHYSERIFLYYSDKNYLSLSVRCLKD